MEFKEIVLDEFKIMGFIDFDFNKNFKDETDNYEFSSWGDSKDEICPYCGEDHSAHSHKEKNWEELYPTHKQLKEYFPQLLEESDNLVFKEKKYEIIKFSEDINEISPSYNMVGLKVKDLNSIPPNLIGMRFPSRKYLSITLTMEDFMTSKELDSSIHKKDIDNYFIIEYDIKDISEYSKLLINIYYPLKS